MDWMQEALSYPECNITRVRDFAPETEMKLAIGQYNRAVRNLRNDSMDIAIIALKRLAAHYPAFAQAVLLYGCCQMAAGNLHAGLDAFARAGLDTFTERFRTRAEEYREAAQAEVTAANPENGAQPISEEEYHIRPTAPLLSRGVTSRRRIRFTGEREHGGSPSGKPDKAAPGIHEPLTMRFPFLTDYRRILAAVVVVALAGLAVFGLVQLGIGLVRNIQPAPPSDSAKLSWILDRLEDTAKSENAGADSVAALIREYREKYGSTENPTAAPAVTSQPSASTAATSTSPPTPTATPIPSTVPDYTQTVATANSLLTDAKGRMAAQPIEALRLLDALADMLQDVPGDARSPGVTSSASEMLAARANLIAINLWHLSESHRIAADAPWQKKDYAACLPLYEAIYRINPEYYTGYSAYRLGVCYEQVGALEQALACYRTVEKIGTKSPQYAGALARIQAIG